MLPRRAGSKRKHPKTCFYCGQSIAAHLNPRTRMCDPCKAARLPYTEMARALVEFHVDTNRIPRPDSMPCHDCGFMAEFYEHRNYNKPLHIAPICRSCNAVRGLAEWSPKDEISIEVVIINNEKWRNT